MFSWLYTSWAYLLILVISLSGLVALDRHWKLVYFAKSAHSRYATLATVATLGIFFVIWDITGILLGIFWTNPRYTIGLNLFTPNLPIEELLFLSLLVYVSLLVQAKLGQVAARPQMTSKSSPKAKSKDKKS